MRIKEYLVQSTDGTQTLPHPMKLHNATTGSISLEVESGEGVLMGPLKGSSHDISGSLHGTLPTFTEAKAAAAYDITAVTGVGSGGKLNVTIAGDGGDPETFSATVITVNTQGNNYAPGDVITVTPVTGKTLTLELETADVPQVFDIQLGAAATTDIIVKTFKNLETSDKKIVAIG